MTAVEYLLEQLEGVVNDLSEDIQTQENIITRAYTQGKRDAYSFVLQALRDGLEEERSGE